MNYIIFRHYKDNETGEYFTSLDFKIYDNLDEAIETLKLVAYVNNSKSGEMHFERLCDEFSDSAIIIEVANPKY